MPPVAVVTDTTAYPSDRRREASTGSLLVPLYVVFGSDRTVKESEITDYPAFFDELRGSESLPTTSQPSVGDFIACFESLLESGRDVVSIHISAGISGTSGLRSPGGRAAEPRGQGRRASPRDRLPPPPRAGSGCWCSWHPPPRRPAASWTRSRKKVRQAREQLKIWFAVDTLEFLKRGGRIGAASAWIGSTLKVKPILSLESELTPVERVRTSARAFERLVDYARQRHESGADAWVVQHIAVPEQADRLVERSREVFGCDPVFIGEIRARAVRACRSRACSASGSIPRQYLE